jgi:hypothetical protein
MLLVTEFMHRLMRHDRIKLAKPDGPSVVFEIRAQLPRAPDVWRETFARHTMHCRGKIEHRVLGSGNRVQCSEQTRSRSKFQDL